MNQPSAPHVKHETVVLALKKRLAKVHRIITAGGVWPLTKGHVSCRVPGTGQVLILGHIHSEGRSLANTDVDDIVSVDLEGNFIEGRIEPVDERFAHTEVYKARPDAQAIVHAHAPILEFDKQIDTPERGRMVVQAIGQGCVVVLKNHGVVVTSDTIENVCITLFALEETAELHWGHYEALDPCNWK